MNALDWMLLCICLFCIGRGIWRGAVSQVFGIVGVFGGFLTATHFYEGVSLRLSQSFPELAATSIISFIMLFLLAWFCLAVVGFWLAKVLHRGGLAPVDRFFGAGLGLSKGVAFAVIMISILTFFLSPQNPLLITSYLAPHVQGIAKTVVKATPDSVQQLFDRKRLEFQRYWTDYKKSEDKFRINKKGVNSKE